MHVPFLLFDQEILDWAFRSKQQPDFDQRGLRFPRPAVSLKRRWRLWAPSQGLAACDWFAIARSLDAPNSWRTRAASRNRGTHTMNCHAPNPRAQKGGVEGSQAVKKTGFCIRMAPRGNAAFCIRTTGRCLLRIALPQEVVCQRQANPRRRRGVADVKACRCIGVGISGLGPFSELRNVEYCPAGFNPGT